MLTPLMEWKLKRALRARRIAVVGASPEQLSIGMGPVFNLANSGFTGDIIPVNPKYDRMLGLKCYSDMESIEPPPDLAILVLNPRLSVDMAERAGKLGICAVTIVVGGFNEIRTDGDALNDRLREIAYRYEMPVIGPNTLGFSSVREGLNGIFWHLPNEPGRVAVISQSGGVGLSIANCLEGLHCGLSHFIGVGNRTVVDFGDYLRALGEDSGIGAFALFVEGVASPRSLYEAICEVAARTPVVVYKGGKSEAVSKATVTHTGSLAGEYRLYRAMFRQAGAFEVESSQETAVAAKALAMVRAPRGNKLCALTFTAGPCIVAMDRLVMNGWELPDLNARAKAKVVGAIGEKTPVEIQNPVDLTGPGFVPKVYTGVLETVLAEDYDAYLLVWNCNPFIRPPLIELVSFIAKHPEKSVVVAVLGSFNDTGPHVRYLSSRGVCAVTTPEDGALALNALLSRHRFLQREGLR
ncbi:MAG: CoA-binding protein [Desulfobacteraceae bacterium]|nr:CoA-binding protein [Desulfobacteraceae bacterium]